MAGIDDAIAAAEKPAPVQRFVVRVNLSTGRHVGLEVPADISGQEALDLIGYVARQLAGDVAKARGPRSQLLVPTGVRIGHD